EAEIDEDAEKEQRQRCREAENPGAAADPQHGEQRRVHAEHHELAMCEVDEVHHPPDQRESGGEQRIDLAQQQPADDDLKEDHARRSFTLPLLRNGSLPLPHAGEGGAAKRRRVRVRRTTPAISSIPSSAIAAWPWRALPARPICSLCPEAG